MPIGNNLTLIDTFLQGVAAYVTVKDSAFEMARMLYLSNSVRSK